MSTVVWVEMSHLLKINIWSSITYLIFLKSKFMLMFLLIKYKPMLWITISLSLLVSCSSLVYKHAIMNLKVILLIIGKCHRNKNKVTGKKCRFCYKSSLAEVCKIIYNLYKYTIFIQNKNFNTKEKFSMKLLELKHSVQYDYEHL